jgi:hypothetical protein
MLVDVKNNFKSTVFSDMMPQSGRISPTLEGCVSELVLAYMAFQYMLLLRRVLIMWYQKVVVSVVFECDWSGFKILWLYNTSISLEIMHSC